ncbi:MAG TPA: methyltransferase domain-containing protein [Anaerolineales bacterium]|nr:methyltransferase domain-containing protein [Anaerolineales bacterium]
MAQGTLLRRAWRRLSLYNLRKTKLTRRHLDRLCREHATSEPTLVVHLEFDPTPYFPNAVTATEETDPRTHIAAQPHYRELDQIPPESYNIILCSGLLEHLFDPQRLLDAFYRILRPGGKLILSVSAVFSFHGCPHDYFHFTPYSMRLMLKGWRNVSIKGNSQPFETIGILLQRITLQCEMYRPFRLIVELVAHLVPLFDKLIIRQYNTLLSQRDERCRTDSMMPSNLQIVALK